MPGPDDAQVESVAPPGVVPMVALRDVERLRLIYPCPAIGVDEADPPVAAGGQVVDDVPESDAAGAGDEGAGAGKIVRQEGIVPGIDVEVRLSNSPSCASTTTPSSAAKIGTPASCSAK